MPKNAVDMCMLCQQLKCSCGAAPKPEKVRKRAPKEETPASPVAVSPQPVEQAQPKCNWCTQEERAAGMPCACNPPASPAPPITPDPPKASARAAMKARAARSRTAPAAPPPPPRTFKVTPTVVERDEVMDQAIIAAAAIMSPEEKSKHKDTLWQVPGPVRARARDWQVKVHGS